MSPSIVVRPLLEVDLARCGWSGRTLHLEQVRAVLRDRVPGGADYLLVLADDVPVSMGGVDYESHPDAPALWQLSTDAARRSQGFGTVLIGALEEAARRRGYGVVRLSVEDDNPRAQGLSERLCCRPTGEIECASWEAELPTGGIGRHEARCVVMTEDLTETVLVPEPPDGDERSILLGWLAFHRDAFAATCSGLDADQLATRSAPPSALSLLGVMRHLTEMERVFGGWAMGPHVPLW